MTNRWNKGAGGGELLPGTLTSETLYSSPVVTIGEFRCAAGHEMWRRTNRIESGHLLVFPRNFVRIRQAGHDAFVSTPNHVVLYNAGQEYTRSLVSPEGDMCEFFAFPAKIVTEVIAAIDPSVVDRPLRPFRFDHVLSDSVEYSTQRMMYEAAKSGDHSETLLLEESALYLLRHVLHSAYRQRGWSSPLSKRRSWRSHRETVEQVKLWLAAHHRRSLQLSELARAAGVSVFHLCRIFRTHVGMPLHRYLVLLRLRAGLEQLMDRRMSLASLALDMGFSSQSHLSLCMRREFGLVPSDLRRRALPDNIQKLSKILQDSPSGKS